MWDILAVAATPPAMWLAWLVGDRAAAWVNRYAAGEPGPTGGGPSTDGGGG